MRADWRTLATAALLVASGCDTASSPPAPATPMSRDDVAGRRWVLTQLGEDEPPAPGIEISLTFEDGRISGNSGCNRYFAAASFAEERDALTIGPIGATRKACPEPVMELERRFQQALENVKRLGLVDGRLLLFYSATDDSQVLSFREQPDSRREE